MKRLTTILSKLPGIGPKSAERLALKLMREPLLAGELANALGEVQQHKPCSLCGNVSDVDPCSICGDAKRDDQVLCVVAGAADMLAIERTSAFRGRYHLLGGLLAPLEGTGPDDLRIEELIHRLPGSEVREVILALAPTPEGDATTTYLAFMLKRVGVKVTRLATGLPYDSAIADTDPITVARALERRYETD